MIGTESSYGRPGDGEGPWQTGGQHDGAGPPTPKGGAAGHDPDDPDAEEFQEWWEKKDARSPGAGVFYVLGGLLFAAVLVGGFFMAYRAGSAVSALQSPDAQTAVASDREALAEAEQQIAQLERQIDQLKTAEAGGDAARADDATGATDLAAEDDLRVEELEALLETLGAEKAALEEALAAAESERADLKGALQDADSREAELEARVEEQQGMILIARGLDHPPCWTNPDSATVPDYIYNIDISDAGLLVSKAFPPRRAEAYGALPTQQMVLGDRVTVDAFRTMAEPIYAAASETGCRHFVRIYEGEHTDVDRYKSQRDAIESYFYIFRVRR